MKYTVTYSDSNFNASNLTTLGVILNKTGTANGVVSSVLGTGNQRTITISAITGKGALGISVVAGTATDKAGNKALAADPSATFAVGNTPPTLVSLSPASLDSPAGKAESFIAAYSDVYGYKTLKTVDLRVNSTTGGANAIWLRYNASTKRLNLASDAGTFSTIGCTPGSAGTLSNSQGSLNCQQTTVSGSGGELTVHWNITPKAAFGSATPNQLWMIARDNTGVTSGWEEKGSWTIDATPPTLGSLIPSNASTKAGIAETLTAVYGDADGYANLKIIELLVGPAGSWANAIRVSYNASSKKLYLATDSGTFSSIGCAPGIAGTLANSQGTLNCQKTTVSGFDNKLTIKWNIIPKVAFASTTPKKVWMTATDNAGLTTGQILKGSWTINP